jgi:RHH-type rel operon transcriptional repressor/antitoxin RelB
MLDLHLPADIEKRLDELARKTGRSKSDHVRDAVIEHLDDLEDLQLAEERLRELREGSSRTIPIAELMKAHGLEN